MSRRLICTAISIPLLIFSVTAAEVQKRIGFSSSATGIAVHPSSVLLHNDELGIPRTLVHDQLPVSGRLDVSLPIGTWRVTINAVGFQSMESILSVAATENWDTEYFLDPIETPLELKSASIEAHRRSDATLIIGFVTDRETGLPLANVSIQIPGASDSHTDTQGFFTAYIPVNSSSPHIAFSKSGYVTEQYLNLETWPNGDWVYTIRLRRGAGVNTIDERKAAKHADTSVQDTCSTCDSQTHNTHLSLLAGVTLPANIRVGRTCTGTSCTTVEVYSMDTYTKHVLPAEWYSCWGSLSNGMNSLQAGAVAIRSYGLWYVYNPLRTNYDICDNTSCQVFGTATSTNANNAVDATTRYIVLNGSAVARAEYSAENNNKGCGDGYTGTGTSWPCISDQVCAGQAPNGHGRGVCQWGTVRWANGTRVTTTSPCAQGTSHGLGTLTWQQILGHYYPSYVLTQGTTATIDSIRLSQSTVAQGSAFSIQYSITTTDEMSLILAASIAPAGTSSFVSDPARDIKASFFAGGGTMSRNFVVSVSQDTGVYDLLVAVWHDKNNNNIIDTGDFIIHSKQYNSALTISVLPVQLTSFVASVVNNRDIRLDWRTLSEVNNYGFYVQKRRESAPTYEFVANGFLPGHGTTNLPHDYTFTEQNVSSGTWFYRLRQVDLDSTQHFTDPVQVNLTTSVSETSLPEFRLHQNYPNPFNPATEIRYQLPKAGHVALRVFNLLGQSVATLVDKFAPAGEYSITWDATSVPSGVYTYRLESNGENISRRMVVIR